MKVKTILPKRVLTCMLLFLTSMTLLAFPAIGAQSGEPTERVYKKKMSQKSGALTPKMIKTCIKMKKKLDQNLATADDEKQSLEATEEELRQLSSALQESEANTDQADSSAVSAHNELVKQYTDKKAEYDSQVQAYNDKIAPFKKSRDSFEKQCQSQNYYDDDYAAAVDQLGYGF